MGDVNAYMHLLQKYSFATISIKASIATNI